MSPNRSPTESGADLIRCPGCGRAAAVDARRCDSCGTDLHEQPAFFLGNRLLLDEPSSITPAPSGRRGASATTYGERRPAVGMLLLIALAGLVAVIAALTGAPDDRGLDGEELPVPARDDPLAGVRAGEGATLLTGPALVAELGPGAADAAEALAGERLAVGAPGRVWVVDAATGSATEVDVPGEAQPVEALLAGPGGLAMAHGGVVYGIAEPFDGTPVIVGTSGRGRSAPPVLPSPEAGRVLVVVGVSTVREGWVLRETDLSHPGAAGDTLVVLAPVPFSDLVAATADGYLTLGVPEDERYQVFAEVDLAGRTLRRYGRNPVLVAATGHRVVWREGCAPPASRCPMVALDTRTGAESVIPVPEDALRWGPGAVGGPGGDRLAVVAVRPGRDGGSVALVDLDAGAVTLTDVRADTAPVWTSSGRWALVRAPAAPGGVAPLRAVAADGATVVDLPAALRLGAADAAHPMAGF